MFSTTSNYKEINRKQWDNFVIAHPNGNIFHTPEMVELYESSPKSKSIVVGCHDESGQIVGLLVGFIQKEYDGILGSMTSRAIVFGGPLVIDNSLEVASIIITEFDKLCDKKVIYSQFRNLWDIRSYSELFSNNGYTFEEHLDIIIDLTLSEDTLWKKVVSNGRNKINKAVRAGTIVRLIDNKASLIEIYFILDEVYKKIKLPLPNICFFENAWDLFFPLGYLKCFGAFNNNKLVGVRLELIYQSTIYDWYAGSRSEYYDKYPNDILPWEIIKWGAKNGYKTFDFGGAGKPGKPYGVRDYKLKFGGTLTNFGRFEKVHKPFLMAVAKLGFKVWKFLKH